MPGNFMTADAERRMEEAIRETDERLHRLEEEMQYRINHIGVENFSQEALLELKKLLDSM